MLYKSIPNPRTQSKDETTAARSNCLEPATINQDKIINIEYT